MQVSTHFANLVSRKFQQMMDRIYQYVKAGAWSVDCDPTFGGDTNIAETNWVTSNTRVICRSNGITVTS